MSLSAAANFAVVASKRGYDDPLYLFNLSFERLIDEIVVPYESKEPFFIDGVPVDRESLQRIKIVQQDEYFEKAIGDVHHFLRLGKASPKGISAADYPTRLGAVFTSNGTDVTSYVIRAFKQSTNIKEYSKDAAAVLPAIARMFATLTQLVN